MIPIPLFIYYIIIAVFTSGFVLLAIIPSRKETPTESIFNFELTKLLIEKEGDWAKALTHISLLILTASLASLLNVRFDEFNSLIGILAVTSLFNLFFSVYLHLSEHFSVSYEAGHQKNCFFLTALYRVSKRLGTFWHLPPFFMSLLQLIIAGHIIVCLFFC